MPSFGRHFVIKNIMLTFGTEVTSAFVSDENKSMAARGYEFYRRVLMISLTSGRYHQHEKTKFVSTSGRVMFCS